jgi:hypothetical protein
MVLCRQSRISLLTCSAFIAFYVFRSAEEGRDDKNTQTVEEGKKE